MLGAIAVLLDDILRFLALGALIAALAVVWTYWALRAGRLQPRSSWARFVQKWGDPVLDPIERGLLRAGRNPQEAPVWLVGIVVVFGILALTFTRWLVRFLYAISALRYAGVRGVAAFVVDLAFNILVIALVVRVIGSWLGAGRYSRVGRWAHRLTDWMIEPIRKRIPPLGSFDLSPFVAYIGLLFVHQVLLALLQ